MNETIVIPTDLSRLSLVSVSEFSALETRFRDDQDIATIIEAVSVFHDTDNMPIGEFAELQAGAPCTVLGLYAHYVNLINSYVPTAISSDYVFHWKGKDYYFDSDETLALFGFKQLTAGETLTLLELERISHIKAARGFENVDFQLGLEQVAVLLREKGVKLPANKRQRILYIDHHKELFEEIPATVVIDLRFFFLLILTPYLRNTKLSSKEKNPTPLKTLRARQKQKMSSRRTGRSSGGI